MKRLETFRAKEKNNKVLIKDEVTRIIYTTDMEDNLENTVNKFLLKKGYEPIGLTNLYNRGIILITKGFNKNLKEYKQARKENKEQLEKELKELGL